MDDKIDRVKAWRESLDRLTASRQGFHRQMVERKTIAAGHLDDARCEHKALQEAMNADIKATTKMEQDIEELRSQINNGTIKIEELKEIVASMKTEIENLKSRKIKASASASTSDCQRINLLRKRLKAITMLTGVRLDISPGTKTSGGYVVNNVTNKAKIFKTDNLTEEETTAKIWRVMEKTAVFSLQKNDKHNMG
ncbi:Hypothetical protein NTJ_06087 [Nesidiocoris tenuis]|uniref:Kinetochore protein Spc24 n=1 Tax=Nesidiocoris tenuis TaxID=355587 RepID=A0ABN7AMV9_9HEMI|nr:Hypothetical protein NTJ_06087 [Nesidiocoris tenuis]